MSFSTLQCGSWIDAKRSGAMTTILRSFSTLQCGSWIDASLLHWEHERFICFSTLQCGSWIDAGAGEVGKGGAGEFQYPSMRVVD